MYWDLIRERFGAFAPGFRFLQLWKKYGFWALGEKVREVLAGAKKSIIGRPSG